MTRMPRPATAEHYWYGDDASAAQLLEAVRAFRRADVSMRRRTAAGMAMNETDMRALQVVIARELAGRCTSPHHLATALEISTASTTKLLDRLTASGHLVREAHPTDRRGVVVRATPHAHDEVHERLAGMHARMAEVADAVPRAARPAVVAFLRGVAAVLDDESGIAPLSTTPGEAGRGV
ncbi:MarR family transcriptional regulator [Cellulomonas palmilytica]|nr:MarR family transcriptional regulator [Cellulomonas palmilytica]